MQLAKLAGNTVVATCGGGAKAKLLKELGVDRVIDYHSEDIKTVFFLILWFVWSSDNNIYDILHDSIPLFDCM